MNKNKSINQFVLRTLVAAIPLLLLVVIYILIDPFKIVRDYYPYFDNNEHWENWLGWNKNVVSITAYEQGRKQHNYNAFIFGSSISIAYRIEDWKQHLPNDASPMHIDGSNESIFCILKKMQHIDSMNDTIKHALIVLEPQMFRNRHDKSFLFYIPPQLTNWYSYPEFHYTYFKFFLNIGFLKSYIPFKITGDPINYGDPNNDIFPRQPIIYDEITNEERMDLVEAMIEADSTQYYHKTQMDIFSTHKPHHCQSLINDSIKTYLNKIAIILKKHHSDYYISFGPNRYREILSVEDQEILNSIFEPERIYRYTVLDTVINDKPYYYDNGHYRASVCKAIMDSIYSR